MISTQLNWMEGPWQGRLAVAARPRGGDWLPDEMSAWKAAGIDTVFSLLTAEEESDLDIRDEARLAREYGMDFVSYPIFDRQVPESPLGLRRMLESVDRQLESGRNVVLHCRQGIGRTGLVAACLLLARGYNPAEAVSLVSDARGTPIPDTPEQRLWIDSYASW